MVSGWWKGQLVVAAATNVEQMYWTLECLQHVMRALYTGRFKIYSNFIIPLIGIDRKRVVSKRFSFEENLKFFMNFIGIYLFIN